MRKKEIPGSPGELIRDADAAMLEAKRKGRDRVEVFESLPLTGP